jgi:hypothetical protein
MFFDAIEQISESELFRLSTKIEYLFEKIPMANACLVSELITWSTKEKPPAICSIARQK